MNNNEIYVSLDIGTSNVKVIIGEITNNSFNVIGVGNAKSDGIKKGSIVDIDETVRSIKKAVEQAERMVGLKITSVVVGVAGNHIQLHPCHGVVAVSSEDREIRDEDIARVIDAAQVVSIPPEREIIDVIPRQFILDGFGEINDPRGMIGVRLEMEGILITGSKTILHNMLRCVERAGLQITDICLQPLATGMVALNKDEKNLGVALVDIGGGSVNISVFENGFIQYTYELPIGGDYITNDISIGLKTTTEDAERVKVKHGHAHTGLASDEEMFKVASIGTSNEQEYAQLDIAYIVEPRIEEIFEIIENELSRIGYSNLPGGFVLTGGVAAMPGVVDIAQEVLRQNVRVALPDYIGVREPQFTTGVGIIQFTYRNVKIQGKEVAAAISTEHQFETQPKNRQVSTQKETQKQKDTVTTRMKNWFGVFFE
jgi:cell division protein FtsA